MTALEKLLPKMFDLTDVNLLDKIADSLPKIQGETNNKKIIILSCMSKDLPSRFRDGLSIVVSSKSSAGKSTLIDNCLKPFQESVFNFTSFTDSFFQRHFKDSSLNGVILHQEQAEKTNFSGQVSFDVPKFQLSEGNTKTGLSERDKDGKFTATVLQVSGFPIFITSTTNPDIEPQELNRVILLQTDESETQTKLVKKSILDQYSTNPEIKTNDNLSELKKLFAVYKEESKLVRDIKIPFADLIMEKLPNTLEIRRDIKKILNYTCIIAFLHTMNRKKVRFEETGFVDSFGKTEPVYRYHIIADLSDLKEALEIGIDVFSQTLNKINSSTKAVISIVQELEKQGTELINSQEIVKLMGIKQNHANDLLRQGHTAGFLTKTKQGRENFYKSTNKKLDVIDISSIEFTDADFKKWYEKNYSDKKYWLVG